MLSNNIKKLTTSIIALTILSFIYIYSPSSYDAIGSILSYKTEDNNKSDYMLVTRVVDGDTIELKNGEKVRYIGIDTPEKNWNTNEYECYGAEATERNKELVKGKTIKLESDRTDRDKYGRLLRYIWIDNVLVNNVLVEEGYAKSKAYPPDIKYQSLFDESESKAKLLKKGMWDKCN